MQHQSDREKETRCSRSREREILVAILAPRLLTLTCTERIPPATVCPCLSHCLSRSPFPFKKQMVPADYELQFFIFRRRIARARVTIFTI